MEAGESEYSGVLKTHNLLIFRDAQNALDSENAPNWNVSETFAFLGQTNHSSSLQVHDEFRACSVQKS